MSRVMLAVCLLAVGLSLTPGISGRKMQVCTATYEPVSKCGPSNNSMEGYTGYELELFKQLAEVAYSTGNLQFAPDAWQFVCIPAWSDILGDLTNPTRPGGPPRVCDMGVAGISATSARKAPPMNLKFSAPTYSTGRRVMIYEPGESWLWLFLLPFSPSLWVVFFATSVGVTICILALEVPWKRQTVDTTVTEPWKCLTDWTNLQWASTLLLLHGGYVFAPKTPQARVILLGYAFVVLILINLYISTMSSILTSKMARGRITSPHDLAFRSIGIFVDDWEMLSFPRLPFYNLVNNTWQDTTEEEEMIERLRTNVYDALLLDAVFVDYKTAGDCPFYSIGELVLPVNLAIAFPANTPDSTVLPIDTYLGQLETRGAMDALATQFMTPQHSCKWQWADPGNFSRWPQMTLFQIGGLWIILGSCVAAALIWKISVLLYAYAAAEVEKRKNAGPSGQTDLEKRQRAHQQPGRSAHGSVADNDSAAISSSITMDGALQELEGEMRRMDRHVKHLPFVMAAAFDAKLADLRSELFAKGLGAQKPSTITSLEGSEALGGPQQGQGKAKGLDEHFPMLVGKSNEDNAQCINMHLEQQQREGARLASSGGHQSAQNATSNSGAGVTT